MILILAGVNSIFPQTTMFDGSTDIRTKLLLPRSEGLQLLSGNFAFDSKLSSEAILNDSKSVDDAKKSLWLAAIFSAAVPGAGEFYSERYLKSAIFIAVEAAAIAIGLNYNKKGNNQTNFFQGFADQHWSIVRYANWTLVHAKQINSSINVSQYYVLASNGSVNLGELNRLEGDLGGYYSHQLPPHGEQQYYEEIGKYPQFNVGWDDFGNENTPFTYGDPLTSNFIYYSDQRGKANDYYNVAAKAVLVIVVNHIISTIDAAWSTRNYNKDLEMNVSLEKFDQGFSTVYYAQLNFRYNF